MPRVFLLVGMCKPVTSLILTCLKKVTLKYIKFSNSVPCSSTPSEKLAALKLPKFE